MMRARRYRCRIERLCSFLRATCIDIYENPSVVLSIISRITDAARLSSSSAIALASGCEPSSSSAGLVSSRSKKERSSEGDGHDSRPS